MEDVEELALVLVDAFDLDVEERIGIDGELDAPALVLAADGLGQADLVDAPDRPPRGAELGIVGQRDEPIEVAQVGYPGRPDLVADELGEGRIALEQPSPLRDAVRLVVELLR